MLKLYTKLPANRVLFFNFSSPQTPDCEIRRRINAKTSQKPLPTGGDE